MVQNFTAIHPPDGAVSHNGLIIAQKHSFTNHHTMLEPVVVSDYSLQQCRISQLHTQQME